ncbi:hypothetical protein IFR05_005289 [Cadophora sp. M221]|nr:hypothetical protein IFR05_005289 [Cadophora sp. M221]
MAMLARVTRLAQDFSEQVRHRPFDNNLNAECHDSEHLLPNFDSENAVRAWFLINFNVKGPLSKEEVLALPHEVYHASRQQDAWVFIPRETWIDSARKYCSIAGQDQFILKDVPEAIFSNFNEQMQPKLRKSPYIRLPWDTIPGQRIFVYKYLADDFLSLVRKQIPKQATKQILRDSLRGIAELHDQQIVHLDIKPDNIMVNCSHTGQKTVVEQVQVADLENAAYLPKGRCIKGMLAGNDNWRSPEGQFKAELNKPTDVFSFGIVCIYALLGRVIFGPDDDFQTNLAQGPLPSLIRLQRQVSYFGDGEGFSGLLKHIADDDTSCQVLRMLWDERFAEYIPYKPFSEWPDVGDAVFKDLIRGLTNLDATKRIAAHQALEHP